MWISPRDLTSEWQDYLGTTPVVTPGTVADSSNPVGLALDIRAGDPVLGPELVTNGDFSAGMAGWTLAGYTTVGTPSGGSVRLSGIAPGTNFNMIANQIVAVTAGTTYRVTFPYSIAAGGVAIGLYAAGESGSFLGALYGGTQTIYVAAISTTLSLTIYAWNGASTDVPFDVTVGPATVKEVPGNHMLQSTSAARPLESAQVNYLWQDLSGTYTGAGGYVRQPGVTVDDLGSGVYRVNFSADGQGLFGSITSNNAGLGAIVGTDYIGSIELSVESGTGTVTLREPIGSQFPDTDVSLTTTWTRFDTPAAAATSTDFGLWIAKKAGSVSSCLARFPQLQIGAVATAYQRVNTASDYDATGITPFQLYDGTDDGMATASFAAGTLIDGMDCMIAVRRDSAANCITGLYKTPGGEVYIGACQSLGAYLSCSAAGTPTVWVDGTQLAGGTAVTAGTLATALTVGDWHILEFRDLDLSAWSSASFGCYGGGYNFNGVRGDIMLYPSTASTEDKDNAREYLAEYYGVTLP